MSDVILTKTKYRYHLEIFKVLEEVHRIRTLAIESLSAGSDSPRDAPVGRQLVYQLAI